VRVHALRVNKSLCCSNGEVSPAPGLRRAMASLAKHFTGYSSLRPLRTRLGVQLRLRASPHSRTAVRPRALTVSAVNTAYLQRKGNIVPKQIVRCDSDTAPTGGGKPAPRLHLRPKARRVRPHQARVQTGSFMADCIALNRYFHRAQRAIFQKHVAA
jgi:hypothetical protein